ncbi:hypothetical protein Ancab_040342 [Ancistrocladus abbreviatus]
MCSVMISSIVAEQHLETRTESSSNSSMIRCIERERQALLRFKQGLIDDHGILASWGSPHDDKDQHHRRDCCQWRGVGCSNVTGHVIALDLRATQYDEDDVPINLRGNVSASLLVLKHLNYLDLSGNDFGNYFNQTAYFGSYPIPNFIGSLVKLQYLNLSNARLDGEIPSQFKNLSSLEYLDLSNNGGLFAENFAWTSTIRLLKTLNLAGVELANAIDWVHAIDSLPSLTYLNLESCSLSNPSQGSRVNSSKSLTHILLGLNNLPATFVYPWLFNISSNLVMLHLEGNFLGGSIPHEFGNLNSLSDLVLSINQLQGPILKEFCNLISLSQLDLSENQLQGPIPREFGNLSSLSQLYLSNNQLQGPIPREFGNLSSLSQLYLSNNQLQGPIPREFGNLSSLSQLDLSRNQLQGPIPREFVNLSSLSQLDLSGNQLQGPIPRELASLSSLSQLDLSGNQLQGPIPEGLGNISSLSELDLSSNQLEGGIPNSFCHLLSLKRLYLSNNNLTGDLGIFLSQSNFKSLKALWLESNNLYGSFPDITRFPSLIELDISHNQLTGSLPEDFGQLSNLDFLYMSSNLLVGIISEVHLSNLSRLKSLDLSFNNIAFNISPNWTPPFQLSTLALDSIMLGPHFPNWLQTQEKLFDLSITDAGVSDSLPPWFWGIFLQLDLPEAFVNLSYNEIHGALPDTGLGDYRVGVLDLSFNSLEGSVPLVLTNAGYLDISNNKLSGSISSWSLAANATVQYIDLSNNNLSGELPDCWMYMTQLEVLNLENNSFSGKIPNSIGYLSLVEVLNLGNNELSGEVPSSLKYCRSLRILDLSENLLSGQVPSLLGNNLLGLNILILRANYFSGSLPLEICHLSYIQVLDLSMNNIFGTIPNCLYNLSYLSEKVTISYHNLNSSQWTSNLVYFRGHTLRGDFALPKIDIHAYLVWKDNKQEYWENLASLTLIDLSSNKLEGGIPSEISLLTRLHSLNLSRNHLVGPLTPKLGQLENLESLDLSRNQLSGEIPTSFSGLHFLSIMDLSYNNLSGQIPSGTQLQSFNESTYMGNLNLCGLPLLKKCEEDAIPTSHHNGGEAEDQEDEFLSLGFYVSLGLGFITGFWVVCGILLFNKSWRYAYFRLCNCLCDRIFVLLVVYVARPIARFWTN